MKHIYVFIFIFLSAAEVYSQSVNLRLSTQFYSWERADSINGSEKTAHLKGYQNMLLEVSGSKWSFNTLAQIDEDLVNKIGRGFDYRFYNFYLKGTNLFDVMDLKLGRQYLYSGVGRGAIDGIYLKVKAGKKREYQFTAFGGALTPLDYTFSDYKSLDENFLAGGMFQYFGVRDFNASLSYMNKHKKPESYTAVRIDSAFMTQEILIDTDSPADQLIGIDLNYLYNKKHNFFAKAYYDINNKVFYKGEINASVVLTKELRFSAMYEYREPQISYNTIFRTFNFKQNQEIGAGIDYTFKNGVNAFGRIANVIYDDDNSLKFQLGFSHPSFGLSYTKYTGYAGFSDGAYGYYYRQLVKERLSMNAGFGFSSYRVSEYATDKTDVLSGLLGLTFRPNPQFSIDVQGQINTNRIYKYDTRVLVGINYWLFKKF